MEKWTKIRLNILSCFVLSTCFLVVGWLSRKAAFGRCLPVVTTVYVGQVECKRLLSTNTIDWSVATQMGGQVHAITQWDEVTCGILAAVRPLPIHHRRRGSSAPGEHFSD